MKRLRLRLSYANVVSTLCLFILLGGAAYGASKLAKNSVGTKQIKNGAVTKTKISASTQAALKGQKGDQGPPGPSTGPAGGDLSGSYPNPSIANGAVTSAKLAPPEAWHEVTDFLACAIGGTWQNYGSGSSTAAYFRDQAGVVHLKGTVFCPIGDASNVTAIFSLPAGYQPGDTENFPAVSAGPTFNYITVQNGFVQAGRGAGTGTNISIDGISFRCAPSGSNGCP